MGQPVDGRSLEVVLQRARSFGRERLPVALAVHVVLEVLEALKGRAAAATPGRLEAKDVLIGFEGEVVLSAEGALDCGPLLLELLGPRPPQDVVAATRSGDLLRTLAAWQTAQPKRPHAGLLRELMGQLFDAERLAQGHLFVSNPADRQLLRELEATPSAAEEPPASEQITCVKPERRAPPMALIALAGVLGSFAIGAIVFELYAARQTEPELAVARLASGPPPPPSLKPTPLTAEPAVPVPPAPPAVAFDVESAPVTFHLTADHEVLVPAASCFELAKKWDVMLARPSQVMAMPPRGNLNGDLNAKAARQMMSNGPVARQDGTQLLFAFLTGGNSPPWLLSLDGTTLTGTTKRRLCPFSLSDRSHDQEIKPPALRVNQKQVELLHALINVEPDDRFVIRSFPRNKRWVVRVRNAATPPWPVLFYEADGRQLAMVLSHEETRLRGLTSAWLTVPVLAAEPDFSKEVSFELEAGQTAHDTPEQLYARAVDAFQLGNYSTAASVLDRCVNAFPDHADCQRMLGDTYMRLSYRDEARAHYREFLRLAPNDGEAPRVRAIVEEYDRTKQH